MTDFPTLAYLSAAARTEGEMKTALDALVAGAREFPGGAAETTLTIASGNVTPGAGAAGIFSIDTEAAAAADDLANIVQTNVRDGGLLLIRCANAARVVTVKHNAGGAGTIVLAGAADYKLNNTKRWLLLKRTSTTFEEIARFNDAAIILGGTSGGAANVQTLTPSPAITAYATGVPITFKAGFTNTASATMNASALGAKTIKVNLAGGPTALKGGEIIANNTYTLVYDGTDLILQNPSDQEITNAAPTLFGDGTAGAQTYGAIRYLQSTRRGNRVFFEGGILLTAKDAATAGNMFVGGLPYTAAGNAEVSIGRWGSINLQAGYTDMSGEVVSGNTYFRLWESGDNVAPAQVQAGEIGATSILLFHGSYPI